MMASWRDNLPGDVPCYMHMDTLTIEPDPKVKAGQQIGTVGDTGNAKGTPHLYFEYHKDDKATDPWPILQQLGIA